MLRHDRTNEAEPDKPSFASVQLPRSNYVHCLSVHRKLVPNIRPSGEDPERVDADRSVCGGGQWTTGLRRPAAVDILILDQSD